MISLRKVTITLVVSFALMIVLSDANAGTTGKVVTCASISHTASAKKETQLPCLTGTGTISFQSIRGPVVVNVWGSWCEPCKEEIPHFVALAAKKKVAILGIDVEESSMATGRKFVIAHGMNWPNLFDPDGRTKGIFGLGVPVTWFIDASGKVAYKQIGLIHSEKDLFNLVSRYLKIKL